MKVLLIYPLPNLGQNLFKYQSDWMPLGLAFIAAYLRRAGHDVSIYDRLTIAARLGNDIETLNHHMLAHVASFQPDLIGFNTLSPLIGDTVACTVAIRTLYGGIMVAGGHHASALPDWTLRKIPELDFVIQGEGEKVLTRLAGGENPTSLPGLWQRKQDGIEGLPPVKIADLDGLPFPALDLLDMPFYTHPGRIVGRGRELSAASLITSRGCSQSCDFCCESLPYGKGVRMHSPSYVLEWMQQVLKDYRINAFYFLDSDFLVDEAKAVAVCEGMIRGGLHRKLKFVIQAPVNRIRPEILKLLARAGCVLIEMGLESFVQKELDAVGKKTKVEQNLRAIQMCQSAGISPHAYIMTGFPGETEEDLQNKFAWLRQVRGDFTYTINRMTVDPGTKLYREKGDRFFEVNNWNLENIEEYYRRDPLSLVSVEARRRIFKEQRPFFARKNRLAFLRRNPLPVVLRLGMGKIKSFVSA